MSRLQPDNVPCASAVCQPHVLDVRSKNGDPKVTRTRSVVIQASGSRGTGVAAESSLQASFGCAGSRRAPQVGVSRHAGARSRPAGCRVTAAYARPTPAAGGKRPSDSSARLPQRVRVSARQLERFETRDECRFEPAIRRAGRARVRARTDFPTAASATGARYPAGPPCAITLDRGHTNILKRLLIHTGGFNHESAATGTPPVCLHGNTVSL
jgi:hypothetical protein